MASVLTLQMTFKTLSVVKFCYGIKKHIYNYLFKKAIYFFPQMIHLWRPDFLHIFHLKKHVAIEQM